LIQIQRGTVQNPPIYNTIRLLETVPHQFNHKFILEVLSFSEGLFEGFAFICALILADVVFD
jgi:hypothetical protein